MKVATATLAFEYDEGAHDGLTAADARAMAKDAILTHPKRLDESIEVEDVDPEDHFRDERLDCPDCGAALVAGDIEQVGHDTLTRRVSCHDDCGFAGVETWRHDHLERAD